MMMTYKGLASTYNKDLQEDKEGMLDTDETVRMCLQIVTGVVDTLQVMHAQILLSLKCTKKIIILVFHSANF